MIYVKVLVFFFLKLGDVDFYFGLEMKLIGEVMGLDIIYEKVFYKVFVGVGMEVLDNGVVLLMIEDNDKV